MLFARITVKLFVRGANCYWRIVSIVAPQERFRKIKFELSRPAFHLQGLHDKCGLIAEELLLEHEEHILRWAGNLSVINDLISRFDKQEERHQETQR